MDYRNQSQLTDIEKDLIEIVLNYTLKLGPLTICFKDIEDKLRLDLSQNIYKDEFIPIEHLERKRDYLSDELKKYRKEQEDILSKIKELRDELEHLHGDSYWEYEEQSEPLRLLRDRFGELSDFIIPRLNSILSDLDNIIKDGGKNRTPLLGFFSSTDKQIHLCINNINDHSRYYKRERVLVTTFIHEMFHAWNYFASNQKGRSVEEIDEPMVEFGSLVFLNELAKTSSEFDSIKNWAIMAVRNKRNCVGCTSAYGFGYYLYSHSNNNRGDIRMLDVYSKKSADIDSGRADVKQVIELLCPTYPLYDEEKVLNLFIAIILGKHNISLTESSWQKTMLDIIDVIKQLKGNTFTLSDIYSFIPMIQAKYTSNNNIQAKIRQQLQILCNNGTIERVSPGVYKIL